MQQQNPFELFQNTLRDALTKNEAETEKWTKHKEEMIQAETSLREFQKSLQVEMMVPIGKKALMPGFMYHTSEVLVGHGSKFFSKCTAQEAIRICKHRQKYAETHLEALQKEKSLHKNKIELPFMENAFGAEGQEIIEDENEEQDAVWREQRKERVKAARQQEAKNLREGKTSHDELMGWLDELEMREELEQELENIEIEDDDLLPKLLSGALELPPERKRISHFDSGEVCLKKPEELELPAMPSTKPVSTGAIPKQFKENENESDSGLGFWDEVMEMPSVEMSEDENEDDDGTLSDQVKYQLRKIQEECNTFNINQRLKYFKDKVRDVDCSIKALKVHDKSTLITKVDLSDLKEVLIDEILRLEETEETSEDEEVEEPNYDAEIRSEEDDEHEDEEQLPHRRTIKFAKEDSVRFINKFEAPCVVSLPAVNDRPASLDIDPSVTCQIKFNHTFYPALPPTKTDSEEEEDSIASPVDIYKKFEHCMTTPATKADPLVEMAAAMEAATARKSILKYKEKVLKETHIMETKTEKPRKIVRKKIEDVKNVDYDKTYTLSAHNGALRYLFALAVEFDLFIEHIELPPTEDLDMKLFEFGLQQSRYDQHVYFQKKGTKLLITATYNDILIFCNEKPWLKQIKKFLAQNGTGKERGELKEFMGISVAKSKDGICLEQMYDQSSNFDCLAWNTRPDIATLLSCDTGNVTKYIKRSQTSGLKFTKKASLDITAAFERKGDSVEFIFTSKDGPISWCCKHEKNDGTALLAVVQEALWWHGVKGQIINDQTPIKVFVHNDVKNILEVKNKEMKFVQEELAKARVRIVYGSDKNLITKSLMEGLTVFKNELFLNCLKQKNNEKLLGDVVERPVEYTTTANKSTEKDENLAKVSKFKANRKKGGKS